MGGIRKYSSEPHELDAPGLIPIWRDENFAFEPFKVGGFRYLSDLPTREASFAIQKTLFLGFPEVLTGGRDSHYRAIGWCISRKAVIVNRDVFSAGGQQLVTITGAKHEVLLPAVVNRCMIAVGRPCPIQFADLEEIYGTSISSFEDLMGFFRSKLHRISQHSEFLDLIQYAMPPGTNAGQALVQTLVDSVNYHSFS